MSEVIKVAQVDDPYAPHRATMRAKHGWVGPYRLGIAVGQAGQDLPSPYAEGSKATNTYRQGVEYGRENRLARPSNLDAVCKIVNSMPLLQSLLYDLNLLPEQTMHNTTRWAYTCSAVEHMHKLELEVRGLIRLACKYAPMGEITETDIAWAHSVIAAQPGRPASGSSTVADEANEQAPLPLSISKD